MISFPGNHPASTRSITSPSSITPSLGSSMNLLHPARWALPGWGRFFLMLLVWRNDFRLAILPDDGILAKSLFLFEGILHSLLKSIQRKQGFF
ncbi:MAG: hypothetical protein HGB12_06210 [Bacteroidetes bacterium]|nr:hypothetical protein [Bacteroidota bacterium]